MHDFQCLIVNSWANQHEGLCFSEDVEGEAVCPRQVSEKDRGSKTRMPQSVGSALVWRQGCLPGSVMRRPEGTEGPWVSKRGLHCLWTAGFQSGE